MTKKRLYVLFAFLFVAVFALVCALTLTACGKEDETYDDDLESVLPGDDEKEPGDDEKPADEEEPGPDDEPGSESGNEENCEYTVKIDPVSEALYPNGSLTLTATVKKSVGTAPDGTLSWSIAEGYESLATIGKESGTITAGDASGKIVVCVTCTVEEKAVASDSIEIWILSDTFSISIGVKDGMGYSYTITPTDDEKLQFTYTVIHNGEEISVDSSSITWNINGVDANCASIDENGYLTVENGAIGETFTVSATYTYGVGEGEAVTSTSIYITVVESISEKDPDHVHSYTATLTWSYNNGPIATVTLTCDTEDGTTCDAPVITDYAQTSIVGTTQATCTEAAKITYKATYEGYDFENDTYEVYSTIDLAKGHTWILEIDWTGSDEEGWSASEAKRTCEICEAVETGSVVVTKDTVDGWIIYTATASFEGDEAPMTDKKIVEVPEAEEKTYTITITSTVATVKVGDETGITLTATVKDEDGNTPDGSIVWSINEGFEEYVQLTQDEGKIIGLEAGTAVIIASFTDENGYGASVEVYVVVTPEDETNYPPYEVSVNFGNAESSTLGFETDDIVIIDERGVLTFYDLDEEVGIREGALATAVDSAPKGYTHLGEGGYTNYFAIDLLQYVGYDYEISVTFASEGENSTLAIIDDMEKYIKEGEPDLFSLLEGDAALKSTGSSVTLTVEGSISQADASGVGGIIGGALYIVWDSTINIYKVEIKLNNKSYVSDEEGSTSAVPIVEIYFNNTDTFNSELDVSEYALTGVNVDVGDTKYVKYYDRSNERAGIIDGAFDTYDPTYSDRGGTHTCYGDLTDYFEIDLSSYKDSYVTITIEYALSSNEEAESGLIALNKTAKTPTEEDEDIIESGTATTEKNTLSWSGKVSDVASDGKIYLVYNAGMAIYSITVTVSE